MSKALPSIILILFGVAVTSREVRAADEDNYRLMIAQQKKQLDEFAKRLEPFPGLKRVEELVRATVRGGRLEVDSPLFARDDLDRLRGRQFRADIDGLPGYNRIIVTPGSRGGGGGG